VIACGGGHLRGEREGAGGGGVRERTKINRDVVDGGLKLRSPTKITFDMNAYQSDNKVKNCIILNVFERC
jgi:hypothetical protein